MKFVVYSLYSSSQKNGLMKFYMDMVFTHLYITVVVVMRSIVIITATAISLLEKQCFKAYVYKLME